MQLSGIFRSRISGDPETSVKTLGVCAVGQPYLFLRSVKFPLLAISLQRNAGSDYNYENLRIN